jgi:hypothetical protein
MRDPISVLYYPDFFADYVTVMKAILLFDEIHFMDRPSIMFGAGRGQFGTIGAASPLRSYEASFREEGVPLFVHEAPSGPISSRRYEQVKADVNDREYLARFQSGLRTSDAFRGIQVAKGNYGEFGTEQDVARRLMEVDLDGALRPYGNAIELFEDDAVRHFDLSTPAGCAKNLLSGAVTCSAKMNFALDAGMKNAFIPLADAKPYGDLLGSKYARAVGSLQAKDNKLQITDLSFAIFDRLISSELLKKMTMMDVVRYRKESETAREEFLEHLAFIQKKQMVVGSDGDYAGAIESLVEAEVLPAARTFRNKLKVIEDSLFGSITKGVIGFAGSSSVLSLFAGLTWPHIMALAGPSAAYVANALIDKILAERAARRECSVSYVLSLDS